MGKSYVAGSGPEALALLESQDIQPDVVLMDVIMPGMTAKDLVAGITKRRPGVHVVFMSGYMGDLVERQGLIEPGVNFLPKPFTVEELLSVVRTAAGGSEPVN